MLPKSAPVKSRECTFHITKMYAVFFLYYYPWPGEWSKPAELLLVVPWCLPVFFCVTNLYIHKPRRAAFVDEQRASLLARIERTSSFFFFFNFLLHQLGSMSTFFKTKGGCACAF